MRFLVDEMFSPQVAEQLRAAGHDARHVSDASLVAAEDARVLDLAAVEQRVLVTENAIDFVPLLDERAAAGVQTTPVLIALKRRLPRPAGALVHVLVQRLSRWADDHPEPYGHVHWLP